MTKELLEARERTHGDFANTAAVAQDLKDLYQAAVDKYQESFSSEMFEALDQICSKVARIVCGDPFHQDAWLDIAGYATLVAQSLDHQEEET